MNISREFDDIITQRVSEKDSGIYNAMNKGIQMASGDVIGFLNSDDTLADKDILYSIMDKFNKKDKLSVVFGDIDYTTIEGQVKRKWRTGVKKSFRSGWHPPHPAFYAKKRLFLEHGGFDESLRIAADFDLMFRFIEKSNDRSYYLPRIFVKMKLGGESNRSIRNILRGAKDIRLSFAANDVKIPWYYFILRWTKKLIQNMTS
jgi:glycosyltransferase involved in cell wall biosynthesis